MENINPINLIIATSMVLCSFILIIGVVLKIVSILLAVFAFPTYLGMYSIEYILERKNKSNFYSLNIPQDNPWKMGMNTLASLVTLILLIILERLWMIISLVNLSADEKQLKVFELLFDARLFNPLLFFCLAICIISIYLISNYKSEKDENGAWTKIENLSIPSLWKVIAKSSGT